ncbi:ArsR/SmtB family transcription factor [Kribbella sp. NPDC049174]|uniref:ArsR/SmtB family transcription factor n=1 Tax=Kribbella sp. NPDC049174 TaxID=3364112 RepID=UPI00371BA8A2
MESDRRLDVAFSALADPTRRAILTRLSSSEATVLELAEPFPLSQPAISKHLKVLERAGLITRRRDAQRRPCRLEADALRGATEWLDGYRKFWTESYQRLDTLLADLHPADPEAGGQAGQR